METFAMATIQDKDNFDGKLDCKLLNTLLLKTQSKKGSHAREWSLIEILATRSYAQRQDIVLTYRDIYDRYLAQDIRAAVTGPLRDGLLTLVRPYGVRDATSVHKSLTGLGVDEHTLLEVFCSRNWEELQDLSACYKEIFKQDMAKVVKSELSGKFQLQVMKLLRERRSGAPVDPVRGQELVRDLHDAAYGKWGKNKPLIYDIFTRESFEQLRYIFRQYEKSYEETIHELIKRVFSGEIRKMMCYIAKYAESEIGFYAYVLYKATNGEICEKSALHKAVMGHSSEIATLIRIILSRCDIDLKIIIATYEKNYGSSLMKDICMCTHGDLRDLLIAACGWEWPVHAPVQVGAVVSSQHHDDDHPESQ